MKKTLIFLSILLLSVSAFAQVRTGNIYGKVVDPDGNPLPGVSVTLTGQYTAPQTVVSSAEGAFRFLSLPASRDYALKLELTGFKTRIEEGIIIAVGTNANLTLTLEPGVIEEEITVTAVTPVVDQKKTSVGANVTQEVLQGLPTARDPWVILQMAPSVIVDRENVGGAESGQQSVYVGRGSSSYNNNVWAMDGIVITDPAAIGASPSYYDFDAFEEMQITVGGADVTVQTGGIALNMVTRRGGNKISLGGRFYWTDGKLFQAKMEDTVAKYKETEHYFLGINKINRNKDYGFNVGIPIVKDKAWFWGSYGVQDIKTTTVYGTKDDTLLENYVAKLNLQIIPQNRFEAFIHTGGKLKWGRSASAALPDGYYQGGRYYLGSPILKLQDEHMFGDDLLLSVKFAFSDAGFNLTPMMDLEFDDAPIWDATEQRWYGSEWRYYVERPVTQYNFLANYFNDTLFGVSHDIKIGVEYADRNAYTESVNSGNMQITRNLNYPLLDFDGDGAPDVPTDPRWKEFYYWRGYYRDYNCKALAAYFSDTITFGRLTFLLGLRYDKQTPQVNPTTIYAMNGGPAWQKVAATEVQNKLDALLPAATVAQIKAKYYDGDPYSWNVWSPRLGLTYDVTGDGKTILKLSAAQYGDFMGVGEAGLWQPGGTGGWWYMPWFDENNDSVIQLNELYLYHTADYSPYRMFSDTGELQADLVDAAGWFYGGYDPSHPEALTDPYGSKAKGAGSSRTSELMLTLEREMFTDFSLSVVGTYRKYDRFNWGLKYFLNESGGIGDIQNQSWYIQANPVPDTIPGIGDTKEAKDHPWYYTDIAPSQYSPYYQVQRRPDYYQDYFGVDFIVNKRLSNKWMMNANFTLQKQAQHYGDKGYMDPTNIWAYEGKPQVAYIGGASGKINQYTYTRWMFKVGGLYQLPWDISISGTFYMREGWIITDSFTLVDYTLPNPRSRSAGLMMSPFGTNRLPLFYNLTLRLEKMLRIGDVGRIYIMADVFNVLNSVIENRRYQKYWGTYYYYGEGSPSNNFVPNPNNYALNEILNPRVMRLGVRFTF